MIDAPSDESLDVVIAVEDDLALDTAIRGLALFRSHGLSADMVARGSPRKRYDKATKIPAKVLVSMRFDGTTTTISTSSPPGTQEHETVKELILRLVGA